MSTNVEISAARQKSHNDIHSETWFCRGTTENSYKLGVLSFRRESLN